MSELFGEKEASEILQRAAALQETGGGDDRPYQPGITKEELYRIAKEAGIDITFVDLAMQKPIDTTQPTGRVPTTVEHERVIDGELPVEHFDILMEEVRPTPNHQGTTSVTQVGRTFDATTWRGTTQARVMVSARRGRTRVKVVTDSTGAVLCTWLPMGFVAFLTLIIGMKEAGPLIGLALTGGLVGATHLVFRHLLKKGHQRGAELADRLAAKIAEETRHLRERLAGATSTTAQEPEEHIEASTGQLP